MSPKQGILFDAFNKRGMLSLAECVNLVGKDIYTSREKYVGEILKRMISRGWVERVSRGKYQMKAGARADSALPVEKRPEKLSDREVMPALHDWAISKGIMLRPCKQFPEPQPKTP